MIFTDDQEDLKPLSRVYKERWHVVPDAAEKFMSYKNSALDDTIVSFFNGPRIKTAKQALAEIRGYILTAKTQQEIDRVFHLIRSFNKGISTGTYDEFFPPLKDTTNRPLHAALLWVHKWIDGVMSILEFASTQVKRLDKQECRTQTCPGQLLCAAMHVLLL